MARIYRSKWIELYSGFATPSFRVAPASYFDNRAHIDFTISFLVAVIGLCLTAGTLLSLAFVPFLFIGWGSAYINLPIYSKYDECDPPRYGFYLYGEGMKLYFDSFWWCWGKKTYCFDMPWRWEWVRTSVLRYDGEWEHETPGDRKDFWDDRKWGGILWEEAHPYRYILKSKKVQERIATIKVEEREWRWKWFTWLPLIKKVRRSIDVGFNGEVGERTGSWKGGCTGCGYTMLEGETAIQTLRRMEKTRKFT